MLSVTSDPTIAQHLIAGVPNEVPNPEEFLRQHVERWQAVQVKEHLAHLQRRAEAAARSGDTETQRDLVRQILEMRKKVN